MGRSRFRVAAVSLSGVVLLHGGGLVGCTNEMPALTEPEIRLLTTLSLFDGASERRASRLFAPTSPDNPYAEDPGAAAFGRRLFVDAGLSANGRVSCSSCHEEDRAFTDGRPRAIGLLRGARNTPTLLGVSALRFFGWDGSTDSAWAQSLAALESPHEHGLRPEQVQRRVQEQHSGPYDRVFGHPPDEAAKVLSNVGKALEAYVRTLRPQPAPFDRYVAAVAAGDREGGGHLSPSALRGLSAFLREGCVNCHHGPLLSDGEFHNLGLPPAVGISDRDLGRQRGAQRVLASVHRCRTCDETRFVEPEFPDFVGAFKTPTLRNVAQTAPYMHTGQFESLEEVVEFYRRLPGEAQVGRRDPQLHPLSRRSETRDLVEFLRSLSR